MNASDRQRFSQLLTDALGFYGQTASPFALSVWWAACQQFDFEQAAKALTAHAMDPDRGQWAPKPADIVRQLQGTSTDRSLIAWGKVLDAMQRVGAYNSVAFDDGVIHATIEDMGGWIALCRSNADDLPHLQRRFTETYRAYSRRDDVRYPALMPGVFQLENATRGHRVAPPVLVGDPARAQQTLQHGASGPRTTLTTLDAMPPLKRLGSAA